MNKLIIYRITNQDGGVIDISKENNKIRCTELLTYIEYKYREKTYYVVYPAGIYIFPPYSEQEIDDYNNVRKYKNGILSAEIVRHYDNNDNVEISKMDDVSTAVAKYAGPLSDFYRNVGLKITPHMIFYGNMGDKDLLRITDMNVMEKDFHKDDVLELSN